jgi:hypothetical protein
VTVFRGPLLTQPAGQYAQNDYFVLDPGAAQREAGFHRMLAGFLGWDLPRVRRFDGSETPLYLETIFPLLFVEQKSGWSSMPGAFPTYLQIRDVSRRAVEFLMALDTFGDELRRQQLDLEIAANNSAWAATRGEIQSVAASANARVQGVPNTPTVSSADIESAFLMVPDQEEWRPIAALTAALRGRVADMKTAEIPEIGDISEDAAAELDRAMESAAEKNARRNSLFRSRQAEITQKASIRQRLAALQEDLQKNLDAQKLRNFGSRVTESFAADHCPTCFQSIHDTLLAQRASAAVMSIEDNIEYIRSQRAIFVRLDAQADAAIVDYEKQLSAATTDVNETNARLRALRADLVSPSHSPSVATLEERLRPQARVELLDDIQQRFEQHKSTLRELGLRHAELVAARTPLAGDRLSDDDRSKLDRLTLLIRQQVADYGFSTFSASEIDLSPDNFRPQKEGFEIGFELSASDAIRLKWAYHLSLLELARTHATNHPGFVIFDEPRQQATRVISFERLLERAAKAKDAGQQVIFATSENRESLTEFLNGVDCSFLSFDGYIVRRVPA